jgi:hypothetical protein
MEVVYSSETSVNSIRIHCVTSQKILNTLSKEFLRVRHELRRHTYLREALCKNRKVIITQTNVFIIPLTASSGGT